MNKKLKQILFGSAIALGITLIVTQSIYMAGFDSRADNVPGVDEYKTRAIIGLVFAVFGVLVVLGTLSHAKKEGWDLDKATLIALSVSMVLFLVSACVTLNDQKDMHDAMQEAQAEIAKQASSSYGSYGASIANQAIPSNYVDASNVFLPNVIIMPIMEALFIIGIYSGVKSGDLNVNIASKVTSIDFRNKNVIILASLTILSLILLIMGAIYLAQIDKEIKVVEAHDGQFSSIEPWRKTYMLGAPATAVALSAVSLLISVWMISKYKKDGEMHSSLIFASIFTMILLVIAFSLSIQNQYEAFQFIDDSSADGLQKAACATFPVNLSFMLACGLGFTYGSYKHFKENF